MVIFFTGNQDNNYIFVNSINICTLFICWWVTHFFSGTVWSTVQTKSPERFECAAGPALTNYSQSIETPLDAFSKLFDDRVLDVIVRNTNLHGQNDPRWSDLDAEELRAMLGVLTVIGLTKSRKRPVEALWSKDHFLNIPFYRTVFPRRRFKSILAHMRFDDSTTRAKRIQETGDKLQAFRELIDLIRENCMKSYDPSRWMTVDERLQAFRGKFFGKVYIASKPGKFGIKIWVICDALNFYAFNFQVYFPGNSADNISLYIYHYFK